MERCGKTVVFLGGYGWIWEILHRQLRLYTNMMGLDYSFGILTRSELSAIPLAVHTNC